MNTVHLAASAMLSNAGFFGGAGVKQCTKLPKCYSVSSPRATYPCHVKGEADNPFDSQQLFFKQLPRMLPHPKKE